MNFFTQSIWRVFVVCGVFGHASIGIGQESWSPEAAIRLPAADDSIDLVRFLRNLTEVAEKRLHEWVVEALQGAYLPEFLRHLLPVNAVHNGHQLSFWVMADYLAIGDNDSFMHVSLGGQDALNL